MTWNTHFPTITCPAVLVNQPASISKPNSILLLYCLSLHTSMETKGEIVYFVRKKKMMKKAGKQLNMKRRYLPWKSINSLKVENKKTKLSTLSFLKYKTVLLSASSFVD